MTWTKEQRPTFEKINVALIGIGLLIITLGFLLMMGSANEGEAFNFDIFSFRRVTIAPMVALFGFLFIFFAILRTSKKERETSEKDSLEEVKTIK